jgi:Zn-dependent protease with chaperone function
MDVECFDEHGQCISVAVDSDRRLFWLWVLVQTSSPFPFGLIVGIPLFTLLWLISRTVHGMRLRKAWEPLPPDIGAAIQPTVERFRMAMGIRRVPRLVWRPTELTIGGQLFNPFTGPTIGLNGGLASLLAAGDPRGDALLAHELAHVANRDHVVFPIALSFALSWVLVPAAIALAALRVTPESCVDVVFLLAGVPIGLYIFRRMVERRELIADARALNVITNRNAYLELLRGQRLNESRWHPRPAERMNGAICDSPVLRSRRSVSTVAILIGIGMFTWLLWPLDRVAGDELGGVGQLVALGVIVGLGWIAALPVVGAERRKGRARKFPRLAGETSLSRLLVCRSCWTSQEQGTECIECGMPLDAEPLAMEDPAVFAMLTYDVLVRDKDSTIEFLGLDARGDRDRRAEKEEGRASQ